jgi:hypothetical protein
MLGRIGLVLICLSCGGALLAAGLSLPSAAPIQKRATLTLSFTGAEAALTGLQCDLEFDPDVLELAAAPGAATTSAGKSLIVSPRGAGKLRLLITGLNRNKLPEGAIASVIVELKAAAWSSTHAIRLLDAVGTTADGNAVPLEVSGGSVTTDGGSSR